MKRKMPSEDKHIWKRHMRIEVEIRRRGTQGGETSLEARKRQKEGLSATGFRESMALLTP